MVNDLRADSILFFADDLAVIKQYNLQIDSYNTPYN